MPPQWRQLTERILAYNPEADVALLMRARKLLLEAASCQTSFLEVADILIDFRMDTTSLVAGMLFQSVSSGEISIKKVRQVFGENIATLVYDATRLSLLAYEMRERRSADEIRRFLLAITRDLRVVLVRLAVCLQRVRCAALNPPVGADAMAREVLNVFAPIAHRLGIHGIKSELEDLAFQLSDPVRFSALKKQVRLRRKGGEDVVHHTTDLLQKRLIRHDIVARVFGREKHLYAIHCKLTQKQSSLDDLYDLIAYRIIVVNEKACYQTLTMIHDTFQPVPGRVKDYIVSPKDNGYRSLHTAVVGPFGNRVEIQIRTEEMHRVAESGVAAHWIYKDSSDDRTNYFESESFEQYAWLQQLIAANQNTDDPERFLKNVALAEK